VVCLTECDREPSIIRRLGTLELLRDGKKICIRMVMYNFFFASLYFLLIVSYLCHLNQLEN